ncbi:MAG: sn-glycerol-3-phosphate ABC transporter ATP-binding protein UgpC [Anaerolineae bacterium]
MTIVTVEHVSKQFTEVDGLNYPITALDDVSLKLQSGETLAILGPSGCGKSTLLRVIAGLVKPDAGRVLYDNELLSEIPLQERGIGMVFQNWALIPHWEARRNIGFFLKLRKREHEVPERVRRISSITGIGLETLLDRRPNQLSGGEKQRVAVARALTRDMQVLLFDEPFANLDAKLRTEARIELRRLLNEFPITSIYVTHDQVEATSLAPRIAVMREGRIEQMGTYSQLYDSPVNLFIASFVGTPPMNRFEGRVHNGHWYGEEFGGYPIRGDLSDGTRVTMGIRPTNVYLKEGGVAGVVERVTPFLAERYQLIDVWLGKERWGVVAPLEQQVEVGRTIYCDLNPGEALYFDTESGQRIG